MDTPRFLRSCATSLGALSLSVPCKALVIKPVFDASITNHPNAAAIKVGINSALAFYEKTFKDPITVTITFKDNSNTPVAQTIGTFGTVTYAELRTALVGDATSKDDMIALASLPKVAENPANGALNVSLRKANLRALGLAGDTDSDGEVGLNLARLNFDRVTIDRDKFDLACVVQHEVNEVLGFTSALGTKADPYPQDLFRFTDKGTRVYSTEGVSALFSIDGGKTSLADFNLDLKGDYGDWFSGFGQIPQVQDAFFTRGATPDMGVEIIGLDVIGYTLSAPEPGTLSLLMLGGLGINGWWRQNKTP